MMQHADTDGVEEYGKIEETFSTEVLADIVSFINGVNRDKMTIKIMYKIYKMTLHLKFFQLKFC